MTKYEYQYEIFKMMKEIYPKCQINDVDSYIRKLWDKDEKTLKRLYDSWREIAL